MRYTVIIIIALELLFCYVNGQVGGSYTYAFLNLPNSARVASLGGKTIAIKDDDLNMTFHNPSLLCNSMAEQLVLNYVDYFSGIKYGYVSLAGNIKEKGFFAAGIHYINYGKFIEANDLGYRTGTFHAAEYAFNLIYSKMLDSLFTCGINLKPVYSHLEKYNSLAILADAGITYYNPDRQLTAAIVLKNIGVQILSYYKDNREKMPFEIQAGISQKLQHAPFRFSLLLQHLQKPDLLYENRVEQVDALDQYNNEKSGGKIGEFGDHLMRHVILGAEFLPGENFFINAGYNYLRRQELKVAGKPAMVGFSWGFGVRIKKFELSYGRASYHIAGASDHFSLVVNFSELYRRY